VLAIVFLFCRPRRLLRVELANEVAVNSTRHQSHLDTTRYLEMLESNSLSLELWNLVGRERHDGRDIWRFARTPPAGLFPSNLG
jgi:hypothetical protein